MLTAEPLRIRDNVIETTAESVPDPAKNAGADFEIRTRDLRFTKPLSDTDEALDSRDIAEFSPVNWAQLVRLGAVDVTRMRQRFVRAAGAVGVLA